MTAARIKSIEQASAHVTSSASPGSDHEADPGGLRVDGGVDFGDAALASPPEVFSLSLVLSDVGKIIEDQEIERSRRLMAGLEVELPASQPELLHEIGGAGEEDARSAFDEGQPMAAARRLSCRAGGPNRSKLAPFHGERHHLRLRDHRHGLEVRRSSRLAAAPRRDCARCAGRRVRRSLVSEEAGRRPSFLAGLLGKLRPQHLDGWHRSSLSNRLSRAVTRQPVRNRPD